MYSADKPQSQANRVPNEPTWPTYLRISLVFVRHFFFALDFEVNDPGWGSINNWIGARLTGAVKGPRGR